MSDILEALVPAVEEQMTSRDTAFVRDTYDRLIADPGIPPHEAKLMIALCLADESERMLADDRPFDLPRYRTLLDLLPTLPE